MPRKTLIVMVKFPQAGRVKTRLGRDIGMANAAWWYRHQTARLLRRLRDPRWRIVLAVSPDDARHCPHWPADLPRIPQGAGDLGARMRRALTVGHPGPTLLIGSDIPGVTRTHIARAFATLGRAQCCFGPAPDGGFWLIGLRHPRQTPAGFFQNTRWSSLDTLAQARASARPLRIALSNSLADVDTAEDL